MKTICAWCGCLIKGGAPDPKGLVSHGICLVCAAAQRQRVQLASLKPALKFYTVQYRFRYPDGLEGTGQTPIEAQNREDALNRFVRIYPHVTTCRVLE
ncbi:MAG: hypothetical protein MUE94_11690 [Verrucomicrobia bacterium]|jgi:hypothetical protein|nr:hypothetical protein [Verrucomicrobiota bacterium]